MSESSPTPTERSTSTDPREAARDKLIGRVASLTRFIIIAPIIGLAVSALVMTGVAVVDVFKLTVSAFGEHIEIKMLIVGFIEVADIFLLAVVLYIMSLGLYELFIDDNLPLPEWLVIHTLEDLKEKLVGVVIVVLAVFFLGRVIESQEPIEVLYMGGGIAAMIAALSYFASRVLEKGKE